jgi:hypothetical protein
MKSNVVCSYGKICRHLLIMVIRMFMCCWATYASEMLRWSIPTVFCSWGQYVYAVNPMINEIPTIELWHNQTQMNKMLNWIIWWGSFGLRFQVDSIFGNEIYSIVYLICCSIKICRQLHVSWKTFYPDLDFMIFGDWNLSYLQTFLLEKARKCEGMVSFDFHILLLHI